MKTRLPSVEDYIAQQPQPFRGALKELRLLIQTAAPRAVEKISYGVLRFHYLFMLVGIGVTKKYCSMRIMSAPLVKQMKDELKTANAPGTTLHLAPGKPLPKALIKNIVKARMKENDNRI